VDILFKSASTRKLCNDAKTATRKHGPQCAKLLGRRLADLRAVEVLGDMRSLPGARCHELKGKEAGLLAVDLAGGWRLVFEPAEDPATKKPDGGRDWCPASTIIPVSDN